MTTTEPASNSALSIAGVPVHVRLATLAPELTRRLVAAFAERLPAYTALPREELTGDIARMVEENIRLLVRAFRTGRLPPSRDLEALARSAARRAEEGVPLGAVLSAYHLGWRLGLDALTADAAPDDARALVEVQGLMLSQLQEVAAVVADAYLEEREVMHGQRQAGRQAVLSALLDGRDPVEAARRAGLVLPPAYVVLTLALGRHPDERGPEATAAVAARRKIRRVQAELDHHGRGQALHTFGPDGGTALLPVDDPDAALAGGWRKLADLTARITDRAGAPVHAGAAAAACAALPGAARESAEVLGVVLAARRPPGAYQVADVLLEYQLSRPGAARRHLAGLLSALDGHPVLLETLRAYSDCGFGRRRTAAALHIHPNTLDYRLRRITVLTGLDPARPADLLTLQAALVVRRDAASGTGPPGRARGPRRTVT